MDYHHHARSTVHGRELLCHSVVEGRLGLCEVAAEHKLSQQTAAKWVSATDAVEGHIFWDGLQIAFRAANGLTFFEHRNWVDSDRVHTDPNGATAATYTSLPFGDGGSVSFSENYADWDFNHFGGMDYNLESGTHHAQFRQYSSAQGRWMSPDPYDGSYDFTNPQSFNRYSYVLNNPLSFMDPSGLELMMECDDDGCNIYDDGGDVVEGAQIGVGTASAVNSAISGDLGGSLTSIFGIQLWALAPAAKWADVGARAVPVLGAVVSAFGAANDAYATYQSYQSCLAGHS